jgi:hypothetical protein
LSEEFGDGDARDELKKIKEQELNGKYFSEKMEEDYKWVLKFEGRGSITNWVMNRDIK